jgi:hypothetical protein
VLLVDEIGAELLAGLAGHDPEPLVVDVVERRAHDADVGHEPRPPQPQQAGEQLPLGQVARGPEQDDDVRLQGRHQP